MKSALNTIIGLGVPIACAIGITLLAGCAPSPPDASGAADPGAGSSFVADELIIAARPGADAAAMANLFDATNCNVREQSPDRLLYRLGVSESRRQQAAATLAASPLVEKAVTNNYYEAQAAPNDPLLASQWHFATIHAYEAWNRSTGRDSFLVAVIDTGVDSSHPDLAGKVWGGFNAYDNTNNTSDAVGHGTGVAGIIAAAANNSVGGASVAWGTPIYPIRATAESGKTTSWVLAAAIREAVARKAKVINVSFAPLYKDTVVLRQTQQAWLAGSLVVIAAGNTGELIEGGGAESALFVGAVNSDLSVAIFSTRGAFVDLVAPGVGIYTTRLGKEYGSLSGTSFAAPIASGVAALLWSVNQDLRPSTVKSLLTGTARDLGEPGRDVLYGAGLLDAQAAVERAAITVEAKDLTPPSVAVLSPAGGATISQPTPITVWAWDAFGVADVTLYVDDRPLAMDTTSPYEFVLDPAKFANGAHTVTARTADTSGNRADAAIAVNVALTSGASGPALSLLSPSEGATVQGVVTVVAQASNSRGLDRAEIAVDAAAIGTIPLSSDNEATIAYNWNTFGASAGLHTITVKVIDVSGASNTATVHVTVSR